MQKRIISFILFLAMLVSLFPSSFVLSAFAEEGAEVAGADVGGAEVEGADVGGTEVGGADETGNAGVAMWRVAVKVQTAEPMNLIE